MSFSQYEFLPTLLKKQLLIYSMEYLYAGNLNKSPEHYPGWECKPETKEFHGNKGRNILGRPIDTDTHIL